MPSWARRNYIKLYESNFSQLNRNKENLGGGKGCLTVLFNQKTVRKLFLPQSEEQCGSCRQGQYLLRR